MATSNQEIVIFGEIQKKLFYMIPERWESIYLYASIIEEDLKKPVGEMYFYYVPKGILKRKPVNVYQIPGMFNIDEESYNELIQKLYLNIKELRELHRQIKEQLWTNLTISIKDSKFKVEYAYDDLGRNAEFSPYERHIIWRYKNLEENLELQTKEEQNIIERYLNSELIQFERENNETYLEGIYKNHVHNIINYEKTLTVEAALAAQSSSEEEIAKPKKEKKTKKKNDIKRLDTGHTDELENQILFGRVEKMKNAVQHTDDDFNDDIILSSDFMTRKD